MSDDIVKHLHILQHSLGLDQYGRGSRYRNHFVTGTGSVDYEDCRSLVQAGLMKDHGSRKIFGGDTLFVVTEAGIAFIEANSPAPPKLTRAQQRYRDYLNSDCSLTFFEWIKARQIAMREKMMEWAE